MKNSETISEQQANDSETKAKRKRKKGELEAEILAFLEDNSGTHKTGKIAESISANKGSVSTTLKKLVKLDLVVAVARGYYRLNDEGVSTARTEKQNKATINKLLNLYDEVLDNYAEVLRATLLDDNKQLSEKATLLNNFKALASMVDTLMKRWSLVHRGYDNNTQQAQEDAKAKTRQIEKEALENAPLEEQVDIIGSFHIDTKQLIDNFPTLESLSKDQAEEIKV